MLKRILNALQIFRRTCFSWRTAWLHARPIGGWYTRADEEGNVLVVRSPR